VKVVIQFTFFCFFLLAAALVDGIVSMVRALRNRSGMITG
jgi:hypothetical protein